MQRADWLWLEHRCRRGRGGWAGSRVVRADDPLLRDLPNPASIGAEAGRRAAARVGARRIASAKVPVIFDRCVAMSVISPFVKAISGAAVARGSSFLKNKLTAMVFSPAVSIMDDPRMLRALGSRVVDGEGVPTQPRALIEDGVLTSWMLDVSSARQLGLEPNGYGRAGTSNLTVQAGARLARRHDARNGCRLVGDQHVRSLAQRGNRRLVSRSVGHMVRGW